MATLPIVLNDGAEIVAANLIHPHPRNARSGDIGALTVLIKKNGFYGRLIVQRSTSFILVGNHRYLAGVQCGMEEFPVEWLDVDDQHALRILLSDNRSSDLADYNTALLAELLEEQQAAGELEGTGYDGDALDEILQDLQAGAAAANGDGGKNSGGAPIIQYNLIFDDEVQQRQWFAFLNGLRKRFPEDETIAARLAKFLLSNPVDVPE